MVIQRVSGAKCLDGVFLGREVTTCFEVLPSAFTIHVESHVPSQEIEILAADEAL